LDKNNLTPEWEHYLKKNGITDINGIRPQSEDPYGISVLCVQISRSTGTDLRIINRYNHSVTEPDFTFGGNLDKLIPGLEQALYRKAEFEKRPERKPQKKRPKNLLAVDGKFYYYTQEREGVYWGDGFVYNNGELTVVDTDSERVVDGYILSSKKRKPDTSSEGVQDTSPFLESYQEPYLEGIQTVKFTSEDTIEVVDNQGKKATLKTKDGCLVSFHSDELTEMEDDFFRFNRTLESLSATKLKTAGNNCLRNNESLTSLSCDNLEEVKDNFCSSNNSIVSLSLNSLKKAGSYFFRRNKSITSLSLDNLEEVKDGFFSSNNSLTSLALNNLSKIGRGFFCYNNSIINLSLKSLKKAGNHFFYFNNSLTSLSLNSLEEVGGRFFYFNNSIINLSLKSLKKTGDYFFYSNKSIVSLSLNSLEEVGTNFFFYNLSLTFLSLKNLKKAGSDFFNFHESLKRLFPKDISNGICVSLENKEDLKNVQPQKIQETVPSSAPSNGTFILNVPGTVIRRRKDGKNGHGK